ncbi:hypothetical protein Droror1_Dr00023937 [Drosera rotundifolia]
MGILKSQSLVLPIGEISRMKRSGIVQNSQTTSNLPRDDSEGDSMMAGERRKRVSYDFHDVFFVSYGEYWRQVRKISILELFSANRVKSYHSVRMEEVALVCEVIASSRGLVNVSELLWQTV